jgi:hypothetical protein
MLQYSILAASIQFFYAMGIYHPITQLYSYNRVHVTASLTNCSIMLRNLAICSIKLMMFSSHLLAEHKKVSQVYLNKIDLKGPENRFQVTDRPS